MSTEDNKNTNKYRNDTLSVISMLERAEYFASLSKDDELRAHALYFLAYLYFRCDDAINAKDRLKKCVQLNSKFKKSAQYFLSYLWDYEIKPPIWRWWLFSPLYTCIRRIIFVVVISFIFFLFLFHPCIWGLSMSICKIFHICNYLIEVNWTVYILLISFLTLILLLPVIHRFKLHDIEFEFNAPSHFDILISLPKIEGIEEKFVYTQDNIFANLMGGNAIKNYTSTIS